MGGRVFSSFSSAPYSVFMADKEKLQGDSTFGLPGHGLAVKTTSTMVGSWVGSSLVA